ncbi:MAG: dihydroneopterin aldolase [Candidatus Scalindua sp. AMX11]|nr:MAG: dihydroneopterin aldolase [Candidatus Scalindua sp.]NOG83620.1 dihydroneopterin aldolase [Planctomycetota bacterium]RZV69629.1 MAG: dihydroneopterin aldolase [Candidatus Scalindua sp. SCAELEC01]TDE64107.1 MAG: dihydroneopterin aldolase [Candidatus Scalindua sp. AMX11]GJQ60147.1 MAG: dihydroneopterin triphosphate 2'-epimerase [Candidatus Scalindua sp.]
MKEAPLLLDKIHIRNLLVRCIIGIHDEERRDKQDVIINIKLHVNLRKAGKTDSLEDSVDYVKIKKDILALIEKSSFYLIEKLAEEIAQICLDDPKVHNVKVTVDKPGALRFASSAAVEIIRGKEDR